MIKGIRSAMTKIVGSDSVSDDEAALKAFSGEYIPSLIVWPKTTDDVAKIVQLANKKGVPLMAISSGGPRLRGSLSPRVANTIVVNLSAMNKILRVDAQNKVVMVEPGVTYGQLIDVLKKNGLRSSMPFLPAASKSVLSACLDREPTTMPRFHWDSSDPLLCTETVFGTGDVLRTGAAAGPGSLEEQWASGQAQKNPQGPSQFDPFRIVQGSQGTIGIVTWISMKCEMLPDVHRIYIAEAAELNDFLDFNYAILRRRLADEHFMLNGVNIAAALGTTQSLLTWILVLGVSGHGILSEEEIEYRTADLFDIAKETGIVLGDVVDAIKGTNVQSLLGRSSDVAFWKLQPQGNCREIFFTTTLDKCQEFYELFTDVAKEVEFPLDQIGVYVQPIVQGTNTHCGFDVYYDHRDDNEVEKMLLLSIRGQNKLLSEGAYFSRPYGTITDAVYKRAAPRTVRAMQQVKSIFDPNHILNPGMLCFKEGL